MSDLIDRLISLNAALYLIDANNGTLYDNPTLVASLHNLLESLPSEEKRGKWERHWSRPGVYADLCWHCSACGGRTNMSWAHIYYKYCPYCGARMERGTDE